MTRALTVTMRQDRDALLDAKLVTVSQFDSMGRLMQAQAPGGIFTDHRVRFGTPGTLLKL